MAFPFPFPLLSGICQFDICMRVNSFQLIKQFSVRQKQRRLHYDKTQWGFYIYVFIYQSNIRQQLATWNNSKQQEQR